MEKQELDKKIAGASKTILSFCMARTSNQYEAEDLAQEILLEICKSAQNLRDEQAFYGFLWSVARNVYKGWYKKKLRRNEFEFPDSEIEFPDSTAEDGQSDVVLLRRELTLLSAKYRKAVVLYYMENRSCSEISEILSVSESMVKYLLFKSRQILKEGMNMERNYGLQSYSPKELSLEFWGKGANRYYHLCDSKISQNILFACYNDLLTADQISLEIGVGLPYMEDNLAELFENGLLKKDGNRYCTNIVLFTREFSDEVGRKTAALRDGIVDRIENTLNDREEKIRSLGFIGSGMGRNTYRWQMTCILLRRAIIEMLQNRISLTYPVDKFGTACFIWGTEKTALSDWSFGVSGVGDRRGDRVVFMDFPNNGNMVHHYFFGKEYASNTLFDILHGTDSFSENDRSTVADMVKQGYVRMEDGKPVANMPVFTVSQYDALLNLFEDAAADIADAAEKQLSVVNGILQSHVPVHLKKIAKNMAFLRLFDDAISAPVSLLYDRQFLTAPCDSVSLPTTFAVLSD